MGDSTREVEGLSSRRRGAAPARYREGSGWCTTKDQYQKEVRNDRRPKAKRDGDYGESSSTGGSAGTELDSVDDGVRALLSTLAGETVVYSSGEAAAANDLSNRKRNRPCCRGPSECSTACSTIGG